MVGCSSKKVNISCDGNNIIINGKTMLLTEYNGQTGSYNVEGDPVSVTYQTCVSELRDCPRNRQGVHEADASILKNATYFDAYIGTYSVMHIELDKEAETTKEAEILTLQPDMKPLDFVREDVYNTLNSLTFTPITSASFCNCITVSTDSYNITVRNNSISIPSLLVVGKGSYECTQQVEIGDFTVLKGTSDLYDFYSYGDNLIKAVKGTDISQYVTLSAIS